MTYVVVFFWIAMGIFASYYGTDFKDLAGYFISLTGFIVKLLIPGLIGLIIPLKE